MASITRSAAAERLEAVGGRDPGAARRPASIARELALLDLARPGSRRSDAARAPSLPRPGRGRARRSPPRRRPGRFRRPWCRRRARRPSDLVHRPRKVGSRFSANAATPSAWSSVRPASSWRRGLGDERIGQRRRPRRALRSRFVRPSPPRRAARPAARRAPAAVSSERVGRDDGGDQAERRAHRLPRAGARRAGSRARDAGPAREPASRARPESGHEADAVEGGHEPRVLGRDDEVGGQRQAQARAGGDAVDRRRPPASPGSGCASMSGLYSARRGRGGSRAPRSRRAGRRRRRSRARRR